MITIPEGFDVVQLFHDYISASSPFIICAVIAAAAGVCIKIIKQSKRAL